MASGKAYEDVKFKVKVEILEEINELLRDEVSVHPSQQAYNKFKEKRLRSGQECDFSKYECLPLSLCAIDAIGVVKSNELLFFFNMLEILSNHFLGIACSSHLLQKPNWERFELVENLNWERF
ncbi:hypothetical protein V2J09_021449 [Rumex salicifolius]